MALVNQEKQNYYLKPGFIYISIDPVKITTVLGSCVSLCLYDIKLKYGGMNHYLLAKKSKHQESSTRFGDISIEYMIKSFQHYGSILSNLQARIVGGAFMKNNSQSQQIAMDNIEIAERILHKYGIKILFRDTGGTKGRKVIYKSDIDKIQIFRLTNDQDSKIIWSNHGSN